MSGGQDPRQMDWELLTYESEISLYDLLEEYFAALDKNHMVLVYELRKLIKKRLSTRTSNKDFLE